MEVDLGEPSTIREISTRTNIVTRTETDIVIGIKIETGTNIITKTKIIIKTRTDPFTITRIGIDPLSKLKLKKLFTLQTRPLGATFVAHDPTPLTFQQTLDDQRVMDMVEQLICFYTQF